MTDLPERLREAAGAHRPDRERMLARVEHAMAGSEGSPDGPSRGPRGHDRPVPAPWMRVTAVTAAVAGAIGIGGLAVGAVGGDGDPARSTVVTSSSGTTAQQRPPDPSATPDGSAARLPAQRHTTAPPPEHQRATPHTAAAPHPTGPPLTTTERPPTGVPATTTTGPVRNGSIADPGTPSAAAGPLTSNGVIAAASNVSWTQSDVVLTTGDTLTSLTVELRIATGDGETSTGSYTTLADRTGVQVTVQGRYLVYRWTLDAGRTIGPGTYVFSGQFNHEQGKGGTDGDRYTVTAGFGSDGTETVGGGF